MQGSSVFGIMPSFGAPSLFLQLLKLVISNLVSTTWIRWEDCHNNSKQQKLAGSTEHPKDFETLACV